MTTAPFTLQVEASDIPVLAARYTRQQEEERRIVEELGPAVSERGFYTRDEFLALCHWKSLRAKRRYEALSEDLIVDATRTALAASHESLRIGVLTLLDGVSWPTASVLLHFGHPDPYPILDVRALEALGVNKVPHYTFTFWWQYVEECRRLAEKYTGGTCGCWTGRCGSGRRPPAERGPSHPSARPRGRITLGTAVPIGRGRGSP